MDYSHGSGITRFQLSYSVVTYTPWTGSNVDRMASCHRSSIWEPGCGRQGRRIDRYAFFVFLNRTIYMVLVAASPSAYSMRLLHVLTPVLSSSTYWFIQLTKSKKMKRLQVGDQLTLFICVDDLFFIFPLARIL